MERLSFQGFIRSSFRRDLSARADDQFSVLYYSNTLQLVGIAGKPNSVNALDTDSSNGPSQANGKLAGGCTSLSRYF